MTLDLQDIRRWLWGIFRITGTVETHPQWRSAAVGDLQCAQLIARHILHLRLVAAQRFIRDAGRCLPGTGKRLERTSGQEQSIALLSREPALAERLLRERIQQRVLRIRQQFVLFQQREHQGVIA
ncbi:hypothetical protein D3C71_1161860 [compost metagenome]